MRHLLPEGPPPALAPALDRAAEWWAARSPRARVGLATMLVLVLAGWSLRPTTPAHGTSTAVAVAVRPLAPGELVSEADLRDTTWPSGLLPGPAPSRSGLVGRTLAVGVPAGMPVLAAHVAGPTLADRAPAGHVVVAVDLARLPPVGVGAVVDVHGGDGATVRGAVVLDVGADVVWLAVPRADTGALAAALAWGDVLVGVVSTAD